MRPWAGLAVIAFIIALIFHLAGGSVAQYVLDAELLGFIFWSVALLAPGWPWAPRGQ